MGMHAVRLTYSTDQAIGAQRKHSGRTRCRAPTFPLDIQFRNAQDFAGDLDFWSIGQVSISRNHCDGLLYRRQERHLVSEREESYLITVPDVAEIRFAQDNQDVICGLAIS